MMVHCLLEYCFDIVQLWTSSNHHWYMKQQFCPPSPSDGLSSVTAMVWDSIIPLKLHILTKGTIQYYNTVIIIILLVLYNTILQYCHYYYTTSTIQYNTVIIIILLVLYNTILQYCHYYYTTSTVQYNTTILSLLLYY